MSIKTLLCQLVCIGCLLLLPAICLAQQNDVSALLKQAEQLEDDDQYDQAEAIYKQILKDYPGTDDALEAQKLLTISHIHRGSRDEAELALQELLAKFSENEHIAKTVDDIADEYRESKDYDKARQLYQHVVGNWPDADYAPESQRGLILLDILAGDEGAAQTDIDKLLTEFSGRKDIAKVAAHVADDYRDLGKYESALELYRYVVETWPDSEYAMGSVVSIAGLNIELGNETAAQAALDKLIADFHTYRDCRKYDKAKELYKYVADTWPQAEHALDSQTSLAKLYIRLGDDPNTQAAIDKLLAEFAERPELTAVLREIAERCERAESYEQAKDIYSEIIFQSPNSAEARQAEIDVRKVEIIQLLHKGDDEAVREAIEKFISECKGHPYLPEAIFHVAGRYWQKGLEYQAQELYEKAQENFSKYLSICERLIKEFGDNYIIPYIHYFSAYSCREQGDYKKAVQYFRDVVSNWPQFKYAGSAQFHVGHCYKILMQKGDISEAEANAKIREAYENVLDKYPNCNFADTAVIWLNRH